MSLVEKVRHSPGPRIGVSLLRLPGQTRSGEVASGLGQLVEGVLLLRASERFLLPGQTRSGDVSYMLEIPGDSSGHPRGLGEVSCCRGKRGVVSYA